jgi:hypothetical protein
VIISIVLLRVPERAFESVTFRAAVVAAVLVSLGCTMLVARRRRHHAAQEDDTRNRNQAQMRASRALMHTAREPLRARHRRNAAPGEPARACQR